MSLQENTKRSKPKLASKKMPFDSVAIVKNPGDLSFLISKLLLPTWASRYLLHRSKSSPVADRNWKRDQHSSKPHNVKNHPIQFGTLHRVHYAPRFVQKMVHQPLISQRIPYGARSSSMLVLLSSALFNESIRKWRVPVLKYLLAADGLQIKPEQIRQRHVINCTNLLQTCKYRCWCKGRNVDEEWLHEDVTLQWYVALCWKEKYNTLSCLVDTEQTSTRLSSPFQEALQALTNEAIL